MIQEKHTVRKLKPVRKRSIPETGKNGELAIFYNIAYNRTSEFIRKIQKIENALQHDEIRDIFFPAIIIGTDDNGKPIKERKPEVKEDDLDGKLNHLTDRTYSELKVFMWNETKGKDIRFVTRQEIRQINHMLLLLLRLRDYHSHYWHEDAALKPTGIAREVLDKRFNTALRSYKPQINFALDVSPLDCWQKKEPGKLSNDGVNFVLGIFLTRGQMELFMKSREYLNRGGYSNPPEGGKYLQADKITGLLKKRTDGEPRSPDDVLDLEKSRYVASFYSSRDAAESSAAWLGKYSLFSGDAKQFHLLQLTNYLETLPVCLFNQLASAKQDNQVQRPQKRPAALLAASLSFVTEKIEGLEWRIVSDDIKKKQLEHKDEKKEDLQKIPDFYYSPVARFTANLSVEPVITKRLQQESGEVKDENLSVFNEIYTTGDDKIVIRFDLGNHRRMNFMVGFENLKHWGALAAIKKNQQAGEALRAFANDFANWIDALKAGQTVDINTLYLKNFAGGKDKKGNAAAPLLPDILLQLNIIGPDDKKVFDNLKASIKTKLQNILDDKNINHFTALAGHYNNIKTGYLEKSKQAGKLTELNKIKDWIKAKTARPEKITRLKTLEKELVDKETNTVRYEKMQLVLRSVEWLLGKRGKFISSDAKNSFMKYCYLLDLPDLKTNTRLLISDWLNVATTVNLELNKHENQKETPWQHKVKKILVEEATGFDDCFYRITQLAIEKYRTGLEKADKMDKYDNLLGLARRLNIANPSNTIKGDNRDESPHKTRRDEILAPFCYITDYTDYYLHLPHDFFMIAPQTKGAMGQFKHEPNVKHEFETVKNKWRGIDTSPAYQDYFADFQQTNRALKEAKTALEAGKPKKLSEFSELSKIAQNPVASLKEKMEKIKILYADWYTTVVLGQLKQRIEPGTAPAPWNKRETGKINKHKSLIWDGLEIEGVRIGLGLKQLKQHDFYWGNGKGGNLVTKMVRRLKHEPKAKSEYTFEEIKTAMQLHWKESIEFISALLQYEKTHKQTFTPANNPYKERLGYISFENYHAQLPPKFNDYRNCALHGDILEPGLDYKMLVSKLPAAKNHDIKRG